MISFQCPHCEKPLIVPNAAEGSGRPCPGCGQLLTVPPPPPRRPTGRWVVAGLGLVMLLVGVTAVGTLTARTRRTMVIQQRLAEQLHQRSPGWEGIVWDTCDPRSGDYRLSVHYTANDADYTLQLQRLAGMAQSFIAVNPNRSGWLALVQLQNGVILDMQYRGEDPREKTRLSELTQDLDVALGEALR